MNEKPDQLQKELNKQEQIHTEAHIEERSYVQTQDSRLVSIGDLSEQKDEQQIPLMQNAQKQLEEQKPKYVATVDDAFNVVHSEQRMGYKERKRVKKEMAARKQDGDERAQRLSDLEQQFMKRRDLAISDFVSTSSDYVYGRQALAFLDISGTAESGMKNAERYKNLTVGTKEERFQEIDKLVDEMLTLDLKKLEFRDDAELLSKYNELKSITLKGAEMTQVVNDALKEGMQIDGARLIELRARIAVLEDASQVFDNRASLIKNPYYAMLGWETANAIDLETASERFGEDYGANTEAQQMRERFYNKLWTLKDYEKKGLTLNGDTQSFYELSLKQEKEKAALKEIEPMLEQQKRFQQAKKNFDNNWSLNYKDANGLSTVSRVPSNAAMQQAGITDRICTRRSITQCIFMQRTGKTISDTLTEKDKAELEAVRVEVEEMLSQRNTTENGINMFLEMGRGLLQNRELLTTDLADREALIMSLPQLVSFGIRLLDFDQLITGNKKVGDLAMQQFSEEERIELKNMSYFEVLFANGLSGTEKMLSGAEFKQYLLKDKSLHRDQKAAAEFMKDNQGFFKQLSSCKDEKGHFVMPREINSTYIGWQVRQGMPEKLSEDDIKSLDDINKTVLKDLFGEKN